MALPGVLHCFFVLPLLEAQTRLWEVSASCLPRR